MIDERSKISVNVLTQKSETSNRNTISRSLYKYGPHYNKTKMEVPTSRIVSARSLPPRPVGKDDGKDDEHQSKLRFTNVIPRNPSKETSEGVHEIIKHVSRFLEKKTPFKEESSCSYTDGGNNESPGLDTIQFNRVARKVDEKKKTEGSKLKKNFANVENENKKTSAIKPKHPIKVSSVPPLKKDPMSARRKVSKPISSEKNTEEVDKKLKKDVPATKKTQPLAVKKRTADSENEASFPKTPIGRGKAADVPVQTRIKKRPSEIPLRKDRTESYKKPKFVSLLLRKPLKQVESASSIGFISRSKSYLPTDDLCPELQMTISVNFSTEKIDVEGGNIELNGIEEQEMQESIRLDRCFKSPNIPDVVNSSTSNSLEEKPSTPKKAKVIDGDKVKTSSFTVLKTSSTVLDRLESLHMQNVLSKSNFLTSNTSFNSLKQKKKSSLHRLSNKGNKSGLKMKKTKKEASQELGSSRKMKKRPKSNGENPRFKETASTVKVVRTKVESPRSRNNENVTNEKGNAENRKKEESTIRKIKSSREKSALKASRDEEFKPSDRVISGVEYFESQNLDTRKSDTCTPFNKSLSKQSLIISDNCENTEMRCNLEENSENQETPITPPPTPETTVTNSDQVEQVISEEWSSKTIIFDEKYNGDDYDWRNLEQESPAADAQATAKPAKESQEMTQHSDLIIKGTPLNFTRGEPPEKPEESEPPPLIVKKQLRIDLNTQEASIDDERVEDSGESKPEVELPLDSECREGPTRKSEPDRSEMEGNKEGKPKSKNVLGDAPPSEDPESFGRTIHKARKSCSSLKRKQACKSGGSVKGKKKKKNRSDAGDRPSPSNSALFSSDPSLQNKIKPDAKVRSGLTKSSKWEEKSDVFEDASAVKLKRRNSEPNSFRGYIWKYADAITPRGHKTSVSSMTSSLRHLNTDEIDDFIFWEAVPQKMTSCWEMSLYHFKRPWSVLSCSVFRDNRMSSTPGLILENLRNGGAFSTRRSTVNQNDRGTCRKQNPFDVEPSIAQKNIDIRNWLAALNFPTIPSTSADGFSEGNFTATISADSQKSTVTKVTPKRRKVLPNLKFPDEVCKKKPEEKEKNKRSSKWDTYEDEGLTELIRRKSGGFVTKEQYLNSEQSTHRPNVTINFCMYSKSAEESILLEPNDRNSVCEPRKYKSVEVASQPGVSISATIINSGAVVGDQLIEQVKTKEKPQEIQKEENVENCFGPSSKGDLNHLRSDVNIWKYLFLLTLFLIAAHYCILNSFMGH